MVLATSSLESDLLPSSPLSLSFTPCPTGVLGTGAGTSGLSSLKDGIQLSLLVQLLLDSDSEWQAVVQVVVVLGVVTMLL